MTQPRQLVIDPNVYISAALTPTGTCAQLVGMVDDSQIVAVCCPQLIAELQRALLSPKLRRYVSVADALAFGETVRARNDMHPDPVDPTRRTDDPGDDYLVALALAAKADAIVSGDSDLLTAELPLAVWSPRIAVDRLIADWPA